MSAISINDVSEVPANAAQSRIYLLFSRKWVRVLRWRLPIWAHVAVLLVDRSAGRAAVFDVVSGRPRASKSAS